MAKRGVHLERREIQQFVKKKLAREAAGQFVIDPPHDTPA
jgi:hypothetical protein